MYSCDTFVNHLYVNASTKPRRLLCQIRARDIVLDPRLRPSNHDRTLLNVGVKGEPTGDLSRMYMDMKHHFIYYVSRSISALSLSLSLSPVCKITRPWLGYLNKKTPNGRSIAYHSVSRGTVISRVQLPELHTAGSTNRYNNNVFLYYTCLEIATDTYSIMNHCPTILGVDIATSIDRSINQFYSCFSKHRRYISKQFPSAKFIKLVPRSYAMAYLFNKWTFLCAWSSERSNEWNKKKLDYVCVEFFQKVKILNFVERKCDFFLKGLTTS